MHLSSRTVRFDNGKITPAAPLPQPFVPRIRFRRTRTQSAAADGTRSIFRYLPSEEQYE